MEGDCSAADLDCRRSALPLASEVSSAGCCTGGGLSGASSGAAVEGAAPEVDMGM